MTNPDLANHLPEPEHKPGIAGSIIIGLFVAFVFLCGAGAVLSHFKVIEGFG